MEGTITHVDSEGKKHDLGTFDLEKSPKRGEVPKRVIGELENACRVAKDYASAYSESVKTQAEKYKVKPSALKRYVNALVGDKQGDLRTETDDVARLLGQ